MQTAHVRIDDASLAWLTELRERLSGFSKLIEKPVNDADHQRQQIPK
jgi:hypothetical protein